MGEAKKRGTFEERKAAALAKLKGDGKPMHQGKNIDMSRVAVVGAQTINIEAAVIIAALMGMRRKRKW